MCAIELALGLTFLRTARPPTHTQTHNRYTPTNMRVYVFRQVHALPVYPRTASAESSNKENKIGSARDTEEKEREGNREEGHGGARSFHINLVTHIESVTEVQQQGPL